MSLNLQSVLARIAAAETRAGRAAGSVTLVAVSKTKSVDAVCNAALAAASARNLARAIHFGENYVQEALKKMERVNERLAILSPDVKIHWHLIGPLQTNKSKNVVGKFDTIQSVDRVALAQTLDTRAREAGVIQNILIQVKLGDEPTKSGVAANDAPELINQMTDLDNLRLLGLMSLPPIEAEPEASRKYFIQLRQLREQWTKWVPPEKGAFNELSMGTSHDFEVAIEEGATMVRVGTAIFGAREVSEERPS